MKRDLRKPEEEEKWREKANNRDRWKQITKVTVLRSDQKISLTPTQGKQEEEQTRSLTRGCDYFMHQDLRGIALTYFVLDITLLFQKQ